MGNEAVDIARLETEIKYLGKATDETRQAQIKHNERLNRYAINASRMSDLMASQNEDVASMKKQIEQLKVDDVSLRRQRLVLVGTMIVSVTGLAVAVLGKVF